MSSRLELRAMELLLAIAEHGSIGEAARALQLAQPTVSTNLRRLEHQLGLRLVERTARGSRLTPTGSAVTDWAREVLTASDRFEAAVAALRHERAGQLHVSASMTIAEYLMPGWLADLQRHEPDLAIALRVGNSEEVAGQVLAGSAELGFVEGVTLPEGVRAHTVAEDQLAVVVSADHPWASGRRPVTVSELLSARLVLREPGSGTREAFDHAVAALGLPLPQPALELGSTASIKTALLDSDGVGVLSSLTVRAELAGQLLVAVDVAGLDLRRLLRLIWRADRDLTGAAALLARRAVSK
ncbi:LysR family transcriptional regulator [Phytoactinopolyspora halotolerans]|uniref:LysR family transcriptional regulator n=1 Tax=Phytoactinopolyspora halotolerans TaxID=1981512 RepID=A0A6L9S802_9ACTN|nr:LysR family transcriptional regulator [Phytoactinopolyspora halotolerans]NEE01595.1 LysR family transcriptional regulator [Phytoactinopolyspora halotolerans]